MKVLIADDSPTTRLILEKHITRWGHEVVHANDGEEAWDILTGENPPRIAILDWMMPVHNGVQICERLYKRENEPFVYTILLTSRSEHEHMVYALDNGAHNFQTKPANPQELHSYINVGVRLIEANDKLHEYATKLKVLATTDYLTGINNRRNFFELSEQQVKHATRYKRPLSVLTLDIDHFKKVNDTYGHAIGDIALKSVTDKCTELLRESDILGRIGGEEFGIVLPETTLQDAFTIAERLRKTVENTVIETTNDSFSLTISIGVATMKDGSSTVEAVIKDADDALYEAKDEGRNKVVKSRG